MLAYIGYRLFISSGLEKNAKITLILIGDDDEDFISKRDNLESQYLDSIGTFIYGFTSYNDAKRELNRGLDLKGINVILQISVKDILKGLSNNTKNPVFNRALEAADELQKQSDLPYVESFFSSFENIKGHQNCQILIFFRTER